MSSEGDTAIEWRQLVLNLSHQLRREEVTEIAYLYNLSEDFRESKGLAILEKLEKDGYYSMESPKGLATVFYRIKRKDLEKQTKELVKALTSKQKESSHKKRTETKCACDSATYHLMQGALPHIKNARKLAAQCSKKEAIEVEKLMKAAIMNFLKESEMVYLLEEGYITSPDEIISASVTAECHHHYEPLPIPESSRHPPLPDIPKISDPIPETVEKDSIDPVYETVQEALNNGAHLQDSFDRKSASRVPVRTKGPHSRLCSTSTQSEDYDGCESNEESDAGSDHSYEQVRDTM